MTKKQLQDKLNSALGLLGQQPAAAATTSPAATTLPAWVVEAKAAQTPPVQTKRKAAAVKPHWVAVAARFGEGEGGAGVPGLRVIKMFGADPDRRRPDGKFVTAGEAQAVFEFILARS